ncbi:Broad specificity amino-acid racemase YgeA [Castellaniella defragrans]
MGGLTGESATDHDDHAGMDATPWPVYSMPMNPSTNPGSEITRVIGLIGGMSWESSAEYYRLINEEVRDRLGPLRSARILMYSVDFGPVQEAQHEGRWEDTARTLEDAARRLHRGGADCVVLCTNTMHKVADRIAAAVPIPFLHIADPVGEAAKDMDVKVLGLLGTRFTMEQPFMREHLARQHGLQVLVPDEADRAEMHRIIYEELCVGIIRDASRKTCQRIIGSLAQRGAQAVVLGCTEITLLIKQQDSELPVLDTTGLHARAAVDFALQDTRTR